MKNMTAVSIVPTYNVMRSNIRLASLAATALFAAMLLAPRPAQAQLQRVEQTVFGMDCAPCAHALEKRMNQLDGVASASVSLNEGNTTLDLAPDNDVTLVQIRTAVKESGFSAEDATVRATGTVEREDGRPVLRLPSGERFQLQVDDEASASLDDATTGTEITVTGRVAEGNPPSADGWTLHVRAVEART